MILRTGSMANSEDLDQCPFPSGSVYMIGEDLEDFPPDLPSIDSCSRLVLDGNRLTTLENVTCLHCDFISINNNSFKTLTAPMFSGFPNVKKIQVNNNQIRQIEGGVLKGLKGLDVEYNPLEDFPWDQADKGLKLSLAGAGIQCGCAMKRAVERRVVIVMPPSCKGHPGIPYMEILNTVECSRVEQYDTTATNYPSTTGTVCHAV